MVGALSSLASAAEFDHVQSACSVVFANGPPLTVSSPNPTTAGNLLIVSLGWDLGLDAGAVRSSEGLPFSLIRRTATAEQTIETHWAIASGGPLTVNLDLEGPPGPAGAILFVHEYEGSGAPLSWVEANGIDVVRAPPVAARPGELVFVMSKSLATTDDPAPPFTARNRCGSDLSADVSRHDGGQFVFATTTNNVPWVTQVHVFGRRDAGGSSDGGLGDAGPTDAGSLDAGADAVSDAGQPARPRDFKVSCETAPASWWLVALAVWAMRRVTSSTPR
jgi:hypothetical protein